MKKLIFAFFIFFSCFGQDLKISGLVLDELTSKPIPLANISLLGESQGTVTDRLGFFEIKNLSPGLYNLQVSFIGYKTKILYEIELTNSRKIYKKIFLEEGSNFLQEIDISARELERLIKAVAFPHPGAFTFLNFERINVLNAREEKKMSIKGVQGRVLKIKMNECLVQTADGLLWIEVDDINKYLIRVGSLLGYKSDLEIFKMKNEIKKLKKVVGLK